MKSLLEQMQAKASASNSALLFFKPPVNVAGAGEQMLVTAGTEDKKIFYVASRHGGKTMRVGFAAKDRWFNEEIEDAVESNGGTMSEFIEDEMEADEDLEFAVQHFHDTGWFHFASDIPKGADFFATQDGIDLVGYYFFGYCKAILPIIAKAAK